MRLVTFRGGGAVRSAQSRVAPDNSGSRMVPLCEWQRPSSRIIPLAFMLALLPTLASAQERPSMKLPTLVYAGAAALDVWSTADCLSVGCVERNPIIAWAQPHGTAKMLVFGEALDALSIAAVHRWIAPKHPKIATVGLYAGAVLRTSIAARNWQQAKEQRAFNARIGRK